MKSLEWIKEWVAWNIYSLTMMLTGVNFLLLSYIEFLLSWDFPTEIVLMAVGIPGAFGILFLSEGIRDYRKGFKEHYQIFLKKDC
jgi:predicted MFS family arabinose efflux permease